ncbi:MAG: hypothetical protein E6Q97_22665 [Desulfurellales bacterium]|nr:MAG: hypothetical protein E6Q97_22665 [Desulfurellales bacterium]
MGAYYKNECAYWGRVTKQAMGKTSNGNPQFVLSFLVMGEINPLDPEGDLIPCQNHERSVYRVITENTVDYAMNDIAALCEAKGCDGITSFRSLDPTRSEFTHDFTGTELAFYCKHGEFQGKVSEKWQISRGGGASAGEAMDDKEMRQLDALFGKRLKDTKPAAPSRAPVDSVPAKNKRNTAAAMAAQAPVSDGPAPWDENEASAPEDNIPF